MPHISFFSALPADCAAATSGGCDAGGCKTGFQLTGGACGEFQISDLALL